MTELAINGGKEPAMEGRTKGPHEFLSVSWLAMGWHCRERVFLVGNVRYHARASRYITLHIYTHVHGDVVSKQIKREKGSAYNVLNEINALQSLLNTCPLLTPRVRSIKETCIKRHSLTCTPMFRDPISFDCKSILIRRFYFIL